MRSEQISWDNIGIENLSSNSAIASCLIPLLDALGWRGMKTDIAEAISYNHDEMNIEDLLKTIANLRFEGRVHKRMKDSDIKNNFPCLCVSKKEVYTIVSYDTKEGFYAYDGNNNIYTKLKKLPGRRKILTFRPLDESRYSYLKPQQNWFRQILQRFRTEFTYGAILSFFMTLFSLATPFFVMLMISQMQTADNTETLFYLGAAIAVFIIAMNGLKGLRTALFSNLSERLGNIISNEVFRRLLYLSPQYTEVASVQQQANRVRDFETIKSFFSGAAFTSLIDAPLSLILLIGLTFIAGPVVIIPIFSIGVFIALSAYYYRVYRNIVAKNSVSKSAQASISNEMIEKLSEIRKSGHADFWFKKYSEVSSESWKYNIQESAYLSKINISAKTISSITLILSVGFSAIQVMNGNMTGGALFATFLLVSRALSPIGNGYSAFSQFSKYQKSVRQLNRLMAMPIEIRPKTIVSLHKQMEGSINFRNVFLKYGKENFPVLMNLSFKVNPHEMLAISGHGGGGKSSILKLILGMYKPLSGNILIDNMNLKQIDVIRLRKSISYIPSGNYLFSGTLRTNLLMAKSDATELQIRRSLIETGIVDIIDELPEDLDTDISNLPPALNQPWFFKLLHFSQAMLRDSPICLIDELEQNLTENQLENLIPVLAELKQQTTIIAITSNPKIISIADSLLVIDNGRTLKYGSVKELGVEVINEVNL
ncbi:MAG: ATP-binding cassette domain-containing protein [Spirochaetales bacterium]|nr:ATP-binding cassette domain-containing protein [Spirochaetales bacterium]